MSRVLIHLPEGDANPYEAVGWARDPLHPTDGTPFRVGARAENPVTGVGVEWETGDERGSSPLSLEDGVWVGEIGPFPQSGRYRFIADDEEATGWFDFEVTRWEHAAFTAVEAEGGLIRAWCRKGLLTLTPEGSHLGWHLQPGGSNPPAMSRAEADGWTAQVTEGELHLRSEVAGLSLTGAGFSVGDDDRICGVRLGWRLHPEERLYGTGERYNSFDQRGLTPDVRVYEQYRQQGDRTYFPLPWVVSDRGYGLHVASGRRCCFDLGYTLQDIATVAVPGETAAGTWYFGTPREVLTAYLQEVGRPRPLPLWAYGPWMSSNEWDREDTVREMVTRTTTEQIPATVLVIEAWSDEASFYLFNDTDYEPVDAAGPVPVTGMRHGGRWPDPPGLIDWLHENGLRVLLWQIPVLKDVSGNPQHDLDLAYAEASGFCVRTLDGDVYRNRAWWFPGARVIDFTNPQARDWWFSKRAHLVDSYGIDGFKTDGGEHLWGSDVVTHAGETGDEAANNYPTQYLRSYHQFLTDHGHELPVTFSRAGFTGAQAYPAHWAGDEASTWEAFHASLTAGLSAAMSGIAFWGWDIAGFSGPLPTAELYMRATAMAAFSPIMQYHSEHNQHRLPLNDRTPWNVAEQAGQPVVLDTYRFYARLRMNLVPYLAGLGKEAADTGTPLMRPMVLEYPQDQTAAAIDDQFLLGPDLLVAPILQPGVRERSVYLPEGEWWDLWTETPVESGWVTATAPMDRIPVYVRGGAAIPLWLGEDAKLGSPVRLPGEGEGRLVIMVFPGDGTSIVHHPASGETFQVTVRSDAGGLHIDSEDMPAGVGVWPRPGAPDSLVRPLPSGSSTLTLPFP